MSTTTAPKFYGEMLTDTRALAAGLDELASFGEVLSWRPASDLESRSLWRVVVRLPGCEQRLTEDGAWTLIGNCRDLRADGSRGRAWFRFVPDEGPTTSFSADSVADAQRFAAQYFRSRPGAIYQINV